MASSFVVATATWSASSVRIRFCSSARSSQSATDPIRFQSDLRVTIQALDWRFGRRYLPLQDDIPSTAFYYLRETSPPRRPLRGSRGLEVV